MYCSLTFVRYKKRHIYFALCAMILHRIPLWLDKNVHFHKTLGCGTGDTFSRQADWQQYGLLVVRKGDPDPIDLRADELHKRVYGRFIRGWWKFFGCETYTIFLQPIEGHGLWDGKKAFGDLPVKTDYEGALAVLTRATIRKNRYKRFWEHVDEVSNTMRESPGYLFSVGIGETPWLRQATFSVWNSKAAMKEFAYKNRQHAEVIVKTRKENWYQEDMFMRFKILGKFGTLKGINPLEKLFEEQDE